GPEGLTGLRPLRQAPNSNGVSDWTDGKAFPTEDSWSGVPKDSRAPHAPEQQSSGHAALQPRLGDSTKLGEWPAEADKSSQPARRPNESPAQTELSVQSSILSRRRIRSFISPIPAKRLCQDPRTREADGQLAPPHGIAGANPLRKGEPGNEAALTNSGKDSPGASVSPVVSLTSPGKLKTLPPRKGRGLKLEAIVQKIASPNGRKFPVAGLLEGASDGVTLEDILSVREGCWESEHGPTVRPGVKVRGEATAEPEAQLGGPGVAGCPQGYGGLSPATRLPYQADQASLARSPQLALGQGLAASLPKPDGVPPKGYFPSGKKRGRPLGSINKTKRQLQPCRGLQTLGEEADESAPKKRRPRRKKAPLHSRPRRRRKPEAPAALPQEPEIKLRHVGGRVTRRRRGDAQDRIFSPYVLLERRREAVLLCTIINTQEDERNRGQRGPQSHQGPASAPTPTSCAGKVLPTSSHMVAGPLVTESSTLGLLLCCLCGKCANHRDLGDLFGPYYPYLYASTLPKNPPAKKLLPPPSRIKVRHKSMPELLKTGHSEDEGKEPGAVLGHTRLKRRHYSEDCTPSWASPRSNKGHRRCYCCEKSPSSVSARTPRLKSELSSQVDLQLPQLPLDPNELWVHGACVLWASEVYLVSGSLYGLQEAVEMGRET
ncbi:transcription factor 20, partial [Chiloscyllium plagiosum]|uniref:transcription factor 20 n=1 Tax=Chiloscyllium plagiosum TaxID=36176 RepID=UPI001CB7FAF4